MASAAAGLRIILVEGLLDVAALWRAGFTDANTALGSQTEQSATQPVVPLSGAHDLYLFRRRHQRQWSKGGPQSQDPIKLNSIDARTLWAQPTAVGSC